MKLYAFRFLFLGFLFTTLSTTAQLPDYLPTEGLVGWWPFNSNAADKSGNNNNGTVVNALLTTDRFGNPSSAYLFNGSTSMINVADVPGLRCRKITLSAWVKCTDTTLINQIIYKGSADQAIGEAYSLSLDALGRAGTAYKVNSNCQPALGWAANVLTPQPINTNVWIHLVATYDGAVSKIYKNGILEDSTTGPGLIDSCIGGGLRFGYDHRRFSTSTGDSFHGSLDDIGVWNRALEPGEITGLFTGVSPGCGYGNVGVNICSPQRNLHVRDVLRLEPRSTAPDNPGEGDIYYDGTLHKLRVYDGTQWQNCW